MLSALPLHFFGNFLLYNILIDYVAQMSYKLHYWSIDSHPVWRIISSFTLHFLN